MRWRGWIVDREINLCALSTSTLEEEAAVRNISLSRWWPDSEWGVLPTPGELAHGDSRACETPWRCYCLEISHSPCPMLTTLLIWWTLRGITPALPSPSQPLVALLHFHEWMATTNVSNSEKKSKEIQREKPKPSCKEPENGKLLEEEKKRRRNKTAAGTPKGKQAF